MEKLVRREIIFLNHDVKQRQLYKLNLAEGNGISSANYRLNPRKGYSGLSEPFIFTLDNSNPNEEPVPTLRAYRRTHML